MMKTRDFRDQTAALVLGFCALTAMGCDEKKSEELKETTTQAATPAAIPEPIATNVPSAEPEVPPKVRKQLSDCPAGNKIEVGNDELEASIRVKAQKPEGDLTAADLKRMRSLNLSRLPLDELDICLFRHMTELRELFLGPGTVDDLSPLESITKLESLGLSRNPIADVSVLQKMSQLDRLDLAGTKVKDISSLSSLKLLTELTLDGAPVSDISALKDLTKLERLSLQRTEVDDLSALSEHKDLKFLYIAESPLSRQMSKTGVVAQNGTKIVTE